MKANRKSHKNMSQDSMNCKYKMGYIRDKAILGVFEV